MLVEVKIDHVDLAQALVVHVQVLQGLGGRGLIDNFAWRHTYRVHLLREVVDLFVYGGDLGLEGGRATSSITRRAATTTTILRVRFLQVVTLAIVIRVEVDVEEALAIRAVRLGTECPVALRTQVVSLRFVRHGSEQRRHDARVLAAARIG